MMNERQGKREREGGIGLMRVRVVEAFLFLHQGQGWMGGVLKNKREIEAFLEKYGAWHIWY